MNEEQFEQKLLNYFATQMLPKMPNGLDKFLGYMGVGAIRGNIHGILAPYVETAKKMNIITPDGLVDVACLENALNYAFDNVPTISLLGFTFRKPDVAPFISYINE